ncbi:hypothetical protein O0I10_011625 [Lichtheimia ornata]|uniref:Heterokaryon incompatibility domain-containing protein n=1 Tax=Lichtheimia ornata TaxID=688661 RepID=A0AAD7USG5_9FUNG|nr:uncharacterized protein O0I10_011625 [Lichtheimia ornata]KAJ8652743.1 hypothetical protein O0I10_011625 [Lichtheimia ornata]
MQALVKAYSSLAGTSNEKIEFKQQWTLGEIFRHPDIRFLYVPSANEQRKMTLFTPSKHQQTSFLEQNFYTLSHLWDTKPGENLWDVSDFIIDEEGITVEPIPMRPEKRETLLSLLKANPGYWWIDVLCSRSDTPPVIMSGVYRRCKKCFAMIDCPAEDIEYFTPDRKNQLDHALHGEQVEKEPAVTTSQHLIKEAWQHGRNIDASRWFKRVWTLQEALLPSCVVLLSEISDTYDDTSTVLLESLIYYHFQMRKLQLGDMLLNTPLVVKDEVRSNASLGGHLEPLVIFFNHLRSSKRSCYLAVDYVYGILGILGVDVPRQDNPDVVWKHFLAYLDHVVYETYGGNDMSFHDYSKIDVSEKARQFVLSEADNLGQVFDNVLQVNLHCPCMDCSVVNHRILNASKLPPLR